MYEDRQIYLGGCLHLKMSMGGCLVVIIFERIASPASPPNSTTGFGKLYFQGEVIFVESRVWVFCCWCHEDRKPSGLLVSKWLWRRVYGRFWICLHPVIASYRTVRADWRSKTVGSCMFDCNWHLKNKNWNALFTRSNVVKTLSS